MKKLAGWYVGFTGMMVTGSAIAAGNPLGKAESKLNEAIAIACGTVAVAVGTAVAVKIGYQIMTNTYKREDGMRWIVGGGIIVCAGALGAWLFS